MITLVGLGYDTCVSRNREHMPHHNSRRRGPISTIDAFLDELQKSWYKMFHLTSNLLPHYLAKIECSNAQLFTQNNLHIRR